MFPSALRCQDFIFFSSDIFYASAPDVDACTYIFHFGILTLEKHCVLFQIVGLIYSIKFPRHLLTFLGNLHKSGWALAILFPASIFCLPHAQTKKKTFKTAIICLMPPTMFGTPWP